MNESVGDLGDVEVTYSQIFECESNATFQNSSVACANVTEGIVSKKVNLDNSSFALHNLRPGKKYLVIVRGKHENKDFRSKLTVFKTVYFSKNMLLFYN